MQEVPACIGLAVPGRPIGSWSRRTGAPKASATRRDRNPDLGRPGAAHHLGHTDNHLHSADSLAWSFDARYARPLPGCPHVHCGNCLRYALGWRTRLLDRLGLSAA